LALTAGEVTSVPSSHVYTWKLIAFTPRAVQIEQERKLLVRIASIDMLSILVLALGTWWQIRIEIDHQRSEVTMQQQATLLDLAQDAILITNGKQEIMYWNRGAEDQFGWKSEEVLGKIPFELLHEVLPTSPENILAACASAGYWEGEVTRTTRSGSTVISRTRAVWQRDSSGDRVLAINHDITSRKHAEARFLVAIPALVVTLDPEFRIKMWNPATVVASGLTFSQVRDKPLQTCGVQWLSNDIEAQITAQLQAGSDGKMELQFVRDETTRYVSAHVLSVTADAESGAGILLVGTDITDRINLESHRVRSQKLEAIGQLAAGVAHEINSPIQFVGDNNLFLQDAWGGINDLLAISRTMRKEAGAGAIPGETLADFDRTAEHLDIDFVMSEFPEAIERSLVGIRRVAEIVKAMKGFSHIGAVEMKPSDLNREIEMTATVCRNEWKFVAKLELLLDPELPLVPCFEGKMNQVFLNLIVNAAHAITDRFGSAGDSMGRITITTVHDKDWAEIRIRDNGGGIPEKFRSKVFDPFFTTKEVGRGTGQGLALVHTVVQAHEGKLRFESTEGQGTTFFVCLPLRPNGHSA
jgi:PAS domain S-box-containing protein